MTWAAAVLLGVFLTAGTALAIDQPPQGAEQQRAWLVGHMVGDMQALGTFDGNALAKLPGIVSSLTDEQVALLAQYYFLTRSKTVQDAASTPCSSRATAASSSTRQRPTWPTC